MDNKEMFEEKIRGMFDSIWDCKIDHPMYQDTVGELMEAVIQMYYNTTQVIRCNDCVYWNKGQCECDKIIVHCQDYYVGDMETEAEHFCGYAERRADG